MTQKAEFKSVLCGLEDDETERQGENQRMEERLLFLQLFYKFKNILTYEVQKQSSNASNCLPIRLGEHVSRRW